MADGSKAGKETKVTIRTVAADAGVSVAAVSKVMRNAYGVSEALRGRVETSIQKMGYRPSVVARGMRGRTFTLGVLLVGIDNPFLPGIYQGIESVTEAAGYKIMVGVGAARTRTEVQLVEQMIDNRMDGLILVATQISRDTLEHYASQIPIAVIGHHEPKAKGYDTINNDDRVGAHKVVEAFLARGHRNIIFLSQSEQLGQSSDVAPQREQGYIEAMTRAGLTEHIQIIRLPVDQAARDQRLADLVCAPGHPRAIFAWSDLDAVPLLGHAHRLGIRVPEQVAVIGYDNSPVASLSMINLASMDQDGPTLGKLAAEALFTRMAGRQTANHVVIQPRLIVRGSF